MILIFTLALPSSLSPPFLQRNTKSNWISFVQYYIIPYRTLWYQAPVYGVRLAGPYNMINDRQPSKLKSCGATHDITL